MKVSRLLNFRLAVAALIGLSISPASYAADEPLNLLFFGNSFTINFDVAGLVGDVAVADGKDNPLIVKSLQGGRDLDFHIASIDTLSTTNNVNSNALGAGETWDYVVIQELSTGATTEFGGDPADFRQDAQTLYGGVTNHASGKGAGATAVLYETWAYGPRNGAFPRPFPNSAAMQAQITANYALANEDLNNNFGEGSSRLATVGSAFELENFRSTLYDDVGSDFHQGQQGALLAALVLYRTIYNEDVSDIDFNSESASSLSALPGITEEIWNGLAATADLAPISVPEPTSLLLLTSACPLLFRRRKR